MPSLSKQKSFRAPQVKTVFWVLTEFGRTGENGTRWRACPRGVRYMVWQVESTIVEGEHIQGYVELIKAQDLSWMKNNVSKHAHFERRFGTQAQVIDYCKKIKTRLRGFWELGVKTTGQGFRQDLATFREGVWSGLTRTQGYIDHMPIMARYHRLFGDLLMCQRPASRSKVDCILLYGPPGCGKTRSVYCAYEDKDTFYRVPFLNSKTLWFDGLESHEVILFDDFAGAASHIPLVSALQLFDRYPLAVPNKGGFVWLRPKRIIVTTNVHPSHWYDFNGRANQYLALKRRFTQVIEFSLLGDRYAAMEAGDDFWQDPVLYNQSLLCEDEDDPLEAIWKFFLDESALEKLDEEDGEETTVEERSSSSSCISGSTFQQVQKKRRVEPVKVPRRGSRDCDDIKAFHDTFGS